MKYLLSLLLVLAFSACSESQKEQKEEVVKKAVTQKVTPVKAAVKPILTPKKKSEPTLPLEKNSEEVPAKLIAMQQKSQQKTIHPPRQIENIDAKALYVKCSACHGKRAEKQALGKSQVIQGWSTKKIANAIYGYQNGTYGGSMKAAMQGQVKNLSDQEVKALAEYIAMDLSAT